MRLKKGDRESESEQAVRRAAERERDHAVRQRDRERDHVVRDKGGGDR